MDKPELYCRMKSQSGRDGKIFLEELRSTIKWCKGERILDVGCGPGSFTHNALLPFVPDDDTIEACDLSKKMIDFALSNFNHPRVIYKEMDIESSTIWDSFNKESYTKIFSFFLLHWIIKYRETFENMYSLLKPGGEMYAIWFAEHKSFQVVTDMRNLEQWRNLIKGPEYHKWYVNKTVEERKKMFSEELEHAGFKEIRIDVKDSEAAYPSLEDFLKLLISIDPYRKYIPERLVKEYSTLFEEKVRKIIRINPDNNQAVFSYKLFTVRAKKL